MYDNNDNYYYNSGIRKSEMRINKKLLKLLIYTKKKYISKKGEKITEKKNES